MSTYYVKCSGCQESRFVNPKALETRLAKYGSIENIEKSWKCRSCGLGEQIAPRPKASAGDHWSFHRPIFLAKD